MVHGVVAMALCAAAYALQPHSPRIASGSFLARRIATTSLLASTSAPAEIDLTTATDLTNHKLWCNVNAFGAENTSCALIFKEKFEVEYTKGISSYSNGFWRVIKMTDGKEVVEATHPVVPEYMLFFDIWEPSILWRGNFDKATMKITGGEIITNKKRFGIFPYTEVLGTFTADVYLPSEDLPSVDLPCFSDLRFEPPDDFETPYDMRLHPELFDPEYVEWWFAVEEALAKNESPPPRPKAVFKPKQRDAGAGETGEGEGGFRSRKLSKSSAQGSGTAFGKNSSSSCVYRR